MASDVQTDVLSIEEIARRYDGEWVVLDVVEQAPNLTILTGRVLWRGASIEAGWDRALDLRPKNAAVRFFGMAPEEPVLIL